MEDKLLALLANEKDNVATIFAVDVAKDREVNVMHPDGSTNSVLVRDSVPYGHKIAVREIAKGELIIKYGEEIGIATADIRLGDYVHVHNLDSMRGRGDWEQEA